MFDLILAIAAAVCNGLVLRCSKKFIKNKISMLAGNYLTCLILSSIALMPKPLFPEGDLGMTVFLSIVNGFLLLGGFVFMQYCTLNHGVVLTSVYSRLGVLVPTFLAVTVFHEKPEIMQIAGFILALAAIIILNLGKGDKGKKLQLPLILVLLLNGSGDAMAKVFDNFGDRSLNNNYLVYSFFIALTLNILLAAYKKERPGIVDVGTGMILGIPNYFSLSFLLKAVGKIPAFIVYPTFSVGNIILMFLAGVILFKEKINKNQAAAIVLIMISLILLNI